MDLENKKQELEKIRKMLQSAEENVKNEELKKIEKEEKAIEVIKPNKILGINHISFANKFFIVVLSIIILSGLTLAINNTLKLNGSEWTCISQKCIEYATGDEWVKQNCKAEGNKMICEFQYEGQNFRVPLSGVNVSNMVSCKTYECDSKVLVSKSKFQEVIK